MSIASSFSNVVADCPMSSSYSKEDLSGMPILCTITSKCTEINCCLDVSIIGRTIEAFIDLDPCYKTLELGIEAYKTKINLLRYTFGKSYSNNYIMIIYPVLGISHIYTLRKTKLLVAEKSASWNFFSWIFGYVKFRVFLKHLYSKNIPRRACTSNKIGAVSKYDIYREKNYIYRKKRSFFQ